MRRSTAFGRGAARALLLATLAMSGATAARAESARLDYRGRVLGSRQVETMARRALAAPSDTAAVRALLGALVTRLQDDGYLDARATATWQPGPPSVLSVEVNEGTRLRLASLVLRTASADDSAAFGRLLDLAPGGWISPGRVGDAVERAVRGAIAAGHPYAALGVVGWDERDGGVRVTLSGALGPRVTVTGVRFEGLRVTRPSLAERAVGRLVGLPYDPAAAEAGRDRLRQLGLFRSVTLEGLEGEADWSRGRVVYKVEEPRYNRFEGVIGAQGQGQAVGQVRVDLGNVLGTGRAAGLAWEGRGNGVANLSAHYAEPLVFGAPLRLEAAVSQEIQDTIYVRTRWGGRARFALSGQEGVEAGYQMERVVQEDGEVEEAQSQNTVFSLDRDALDDPEAPRRGTRARLTATQSFKRETLRPSGSRTARASQVDLATEWHRPFGPGAGLALEVRAAGRFSSERVLPFYDRLPLGGATSLRSYDEEAFHVDRYLLTRSEWGWFPGGRDDRVFVFWDHAWSATRLPAGDGTRLDVANHDGLGFGLRLDAAGGVVGIAYGWAPGNSALEGKIHLQLVSTF